MHKSRNLFVLSVLILLLSSCSQIQDANIRITNAKIAAGVDDNYMPVNVMNVFPDGTSKVFCWFSWKDAKKDAHIKASWHYITDDIPVLDYAFSIPRKEGQGSVSLSMPEGKNLPPGLYRVNLSLDGRQLRVLTFKVLGKK